MKNIKKAYYKVKELKNLKAAEKTLKSLGYKYLGSESDYLYYGDSVDNAMLEFNQKTKEWRLYDYWKKDK